MLLAPTPLEILIGFLKLKSQTLCYSLICCAKLFEQLGKTNVQKLIFGGCGMAINIQDILAAIGVVINGLPQGLLALTFGFASVPTAIGFAIGAVGSGVLGVVAPISFQAETITLAGTLGRNIRERLSIIFIEGAFLLLVGLLGLFTVLVNFIGPVISNAMMAGVGIILARVAVNMVKNNYRIGIVSMVTALLTYYATPNPDNKLVYTIVISVIISTIAALLFKQESNLDIDETRERFILQAPIVNANVIRGALALVTLNIGANIAFGNITAQTIAKTSINLDHLTIISSLADMGSSLFGGAPVESIISATGAAPHPVTSAVLMMSIMAVILLLKLLPKIGRYVPSESIAGFLFVLGAIVTVPTNINLALTGADAASVIVAGVTMTVTAIIEPFSGMVSGILIKMLIGFFG
jgi:AGZA family xanthine/uracil permease-like MFS transporter